MLVLSPGQTATFEFLFHVDGSFYDPTSGATPSDVLISIYRGDLGAGSTIDGPYSYSYQDATPSGNKIELSTNNVVYYGNYGDVPGENTSSLNVPKFIFTYTIPENLYPGNYSVVATTYYEAQSIQYLTHFQVTQSTYSISSVYPSGQKDLSKSFIPAFEQLEQYKTNSIILVGHADGIPLNTIIRITSIQEGIDLLKADFQSPLLRGLFDAYAAGARDIYICASAPMSEYVEGLDERLVALPVFGVNDATPMIMNFYQRYYERLEETYSILKEHEYLDIIVPLEISFINTGDIDFTTQLAMYCQDFHNLTGCIQIGIIGSRSNGILVSDIDVLESDSNFVDKYTMFGVDGQIQGDMGRFIIPIYGELIINHSFLSITYNSTGSATYAGMLSANPVNESLIRKRVPTAFGLSGSTLTQAEVDRLDNIGINTFTRNTRSRRGNNYEVFVTNDSTMAHPTSSYRKAPQIRLVSMLINEIKALTSNNISKFSSQKAVEDVRFMLQFLKNNGIIQNFSLEAFSDSFEKGKMYFDISVVSTLGLKKISFSIASGQGA